jgi:hypothetical protein
MSIVVISIAIVIENPYAAVILSDVRKYMVTAIQPKHNIQLMLGIYICPLTDVGYFTVTLGQKFKLIASLISVNEPLINAWLAIIVAAVAISTLGRRNHFGTIAKNGFILPKSVLCCISTHAPCPR